MPDKVKDLSPNPGADLRLLPGLLDSHAQAGLIAAVRALVAEAPLYRPVMPRTGQPFSVRMTCAGDLGWVSDKEGGYRYQETHPVTGRPWPRLPDAILDIWRKVADFDGLPDCCLVNYYADSNAKMGLHQDRDEKDLSAPVVSISLGDTARFRIGTELRRGPTRSFKVSSGDVLVLEGAARLAFHGIDRIYPGTSTLLKDGGRINLTLRRAS
ncbi:MAG: alpha-ketoglutarate-dependent dioxygenase AlkB [Alphaproteobacteria bacterium]|nr:MAG: alpha-ketoglutarate-dependent dioxygenase AlkB [Alphaproteobacteria bacterium]